MTNSGEVLSTTLPLFHSIFINSPSARFLSLSLSLSQPAAVMVNEIFKAIKDAIKTRGDELLVFHDVDPSDFDDVLVHKGLRHRTNYLEQYAHR